MRELVPLSMTRGYSLVLFPRPHVAGSEIAIVPAQRLSQQVRRVLAVRQSLRPVQVILQRCFVIRIGALLDNELRPLAW